MGLFFLSTPKIHVIEVGKLVLLFVFVCFFSKAYHVMMCACLENSTCVILSSVLFFCGFALYIINHHNHLSYSLMLQENNICDLWRHRSTFISWNWWHHFCLSFFHNITVEPIWTLIVLVKGLILDCIEHKKPNLGGLWHKESILPPLTAISISIFSLSLSLSLSLFFVFCLLVGVMKESSNHLH